MTVQDFIAGLPRWNRLALAKALGPGMPPGAAPLEPAFLAAGLTLYVQDLGHLCFPLDRAQSLLAEAGREDDDDGGKHGDDEAGRTAARAWAATVAKTLAPGLPKAEDLATSGWWERGSPEATAPFLYDVSRAGLVLYTNGQYARESSLAALVEARLRSSADAVTEPVPASAGTPDGEASTDQTAAVVKSLGRRLFVLSGGPGTGKTTTVYHYLRAVWARGLRRVGLSAPTGRAAARLKASLAGRYTGPDDDFRQWLAGLEASTVHRYAGRGRLTRLELRDLEVLVVDEASMMDARLAIDILEGLDPDASLVLVGDHNQLPSVDEGALLADLHDLARGAPWYHELTTSFRAGEEVLRVPGLLAGQAGADAVMGSIAVLASVAEPGPGLVCLPGQTGDGRRNWEAEEALRDSLVTEWITKATTLDSEGGKDADMVSLDRVVLLSPVRKGFWGTEALNRSAWKAWRIHMKNHGKGHPAPGPQIAGMPVLEGMPLMVRTNNYALGVFNGDRGQARHTEGTWVLRLAGRDIPLDQVPDLEPSFAMTIHKSQGSEWDRVLVCLEARGATRELLYTALTRARKSWIVVADPGVLGKVIDRPTERWSTLASRLTVIGLGG